MLVSLKQRKVWLPLIILFVLMAVSGFYHSVFIWCNSQFEIWCGIEAGVVGFTVFIPYHGQYADGIHVEFDESNIHYLSSQIPAWFRFDWGRRTGVFGVATSYGMNIPIWFLMLTYFLVMHTLRKSRLGS